MNFNENESVLMMINTFSIKHRSCDKLILFFIKKVKNFAIVVVLLKCIKFKGSVSNSACNAVVVVRLIACKSTYAGSLILNIKIFIIQICIFFTNFCVQCN